MIKRLLILTISALMLIAVPQTVMAQSVQQKSNIENEQFPISVSVSVSTVHIKNADKMVLEVYNIAGVKVATYRIDSPDKTIDFNDMPKGCYILKIGKFVRKVNIK